MRRSKDQRKTVVAVVCVGFAATLFPGCSTGPHSDIADKPGNAQSLGGWEGADPLCGTDPNILAAPSDVCAESAVSCDDADGGLDDDMRAAADELAGEWGVAPLGSNELEGCSAPGSPSLEPSLGPASARSRFEHLLAETDASLDAMGAASADSGATMTDAGAADAGAACVASTPQALSCDFYSCCEGKLGCQSATATGNNYTGGVVGAGPGYGPKYCGKFSGLRSQHGGALGTWIASTLVCLQRFLSNSGYCAANEPPVGTTAAARCTNLTNAAFGSHVCCYVDPTNAAPGVACPVPAPGSNVASSVCNLSVADQIRIFRTVNVRDQLDTRALNQITGALSKCAGADWKKAVFVARSLARPNH